MGPLLPPFLSFASGIALGGPPGLGYAASIGALAASVVLILLLYFMKSRFSALALIPLFFSLGSLFITPYATPELTASHILNMVRQDPQAQRAGSLIEGRVEAIESTGRRTKLWLDTDGFMDKTGRKSVSGLVLLSINARVELLPGDRVRLLAMLGEPHTFGNPGEFDYRQWLKRRGVLVTGYVKSARLIERLEEGGGPAAFIHRARTEIARFIDSSGARYPEPLKALVISGQGGIDRALREAFAATGTAHILSISGLHVGMVAAFSYWAAFFLFRRSERALLALNARKTAIILAAVPTVIYALLAGLPLPTQRAVVMALAFIASFAIGRGKDHLNTLSLAGLVILAANPVSVWDVSFQLSFGAMASIIILVPRFKLLFGAAFESEEKDKGAKKAILSFFKKRILPLLLVTIAAGVGTSPILAYHFHRVSLAGLAANLVAVPLAGVAVPSLLVSSALIPVSEALAWLTLFPADMAFSLIAGAVTLFASIPYASLWVAPPALHEVVLYYLLIFSGAHLGRARIYRYAAPASAMLLVALPWAMHLKEAPAVLRVTCLSVGQGDSAFVELPGGKTMLIDGGGTNNPDFDTGERVVAPFLRSKGVKRIDYMVLSHAQQDHMGGLLFVARNMEVGEFWWNGEGDLGRLGAALDANGVVKRTVNSSTGTAKAGNAEIEFLNSSGGADLDTNDNSLVMKVSFGERSFLFTGDIGEKAEKLLAGKDVRADVLKAPHHGSKYSSTADFLSAVRPSTVVISAGRLNSFGFPHREALERYRDAGAEVLRTDTMGAVIIETDGKGLQKKGYLTDGEL